jgi:ribosomal protein S6--L-glutamate ligase
MPRPLSLITFDPMRTMDVPGVSYIKPESTRLHMNQLLQADWLLFPPYWLVNALYYGLKKPVFPSISSYHLGHNKIEMTRAVQLLWPAHMPRTAILANTEHARNRVLEHFDFPFVAKAIKDSMGRGVWRISNHRDWRQYVDGHETLYIQEVLPIDRDLRLVVVGRRVVAGYWRIRRNHAFHTNVSQGGCIDPVQIPDAAIILVEQMARQLAIDHAGFDLACVDGRFYFFEFNRLFGMSGLKQMGISTGPLIRDYLETRAAEGLDRQADGLHITYEMAS